MLKKKDAALRQSTTWKNLENLMLGEIARHRRTNDCMTAVIGIIESRQIQDRK